MQQARPFIHQTRQSRRGPLQVNCQLGGRNFNYQPPAHAIVLLRSKTGRRRRLSQCWNRLLTGLSRRACRVALAVGKPYVSQRCRQRTPCSERLDVSRIDLVQRPMQPELPAMLLEPVPTAEFVAIRTSHMREVLRLSTRWD